MSATDSAVPPGPQGRFEYFMLRVYLAEDDSRSIAGQVERLGTGEKRQFDTDVELIALVTHWPVTTRSGGNQP